MLNLKLRLPISNAVECNTSEKERNPVILKAFKMSLLRVPFQPTYHFQMTPHAFDPFNAILSVCLTT